LLKRSGLRQTFQIQSGLFGHRRFVQNIGAQIAVLAALSLTQQLLLPIKITGDDFRLSAKMQVILPLISAIC
jgi:hypothetical protein